jgi:hypothetical protein
MIAMMNPEKSWVAKWQRMKSKSSSIYWIFGNGTSLFTIFFPPDKFFSLSQETLVPGCYAIVVHGRLPSHVIDQLNALGSTYKPRE